MFATFTVAMAGFASAAAYGAVPSRLGVGVPLGGGTSSSRHEGAVAPSGMPSEVRAISAPGLERRRAASGISLTPSTTKPRWACPQRACEAIIDPRPIRAARGYALPRGPQLEGSGELGGYDPQDLQSAYKIPTATASTQTIALVDAYGYTAAEADLAKYRERYGLPACTKGNGCFRKVNEKGEEANYPANNEEWELESALDLDMASAACAKCHIVLVEATTELPADTAESVNTAAKLGATEISNSYGYPEEYEPFCGKTGCAEYSKDYNHAGVMVTVSSGDSGYNDHFFGLASPDFPATSPYVLAVGGTSLRKAANSRGWSEEVWNEPTRKIGTGSGCSKFESKPAWQTDKACAKRMDNDVAAVAAVETPVSVYSSLIVGGWEDFGGTSASSPLVAGILAHASAYTRSLGADAFYEQPGSLFDVTAGSNGSCTPPAEDEYFCHAKLAYDGPTGLGTPDGVPAARPTAVTEAASVVAPTSATLNAKVNPNGGEVSECRLEYGTTVSYGLSATCTPPPGSGETAVAVSASVTGLSENTTYHFRVVAVNAGGTSSGSDQSFKTPRAPPSAVTGAASAVTQSAARLNATVNPNGSEVGECKLEYGTSVSYGSSATCVPAPGSGKSPVEVSASVTGLAANASYHFRVVASNAGGTSYGTDKTFATLPNTGTPHWYRNGARATEGERVPVIGWGTLALISSAGNVTCHTASGGYVESPVGGGAGVGEAQAFATFDCESEKICPLGATTEVSAESLPWESVLEVAAGVTRMRSTGVKEFVKCVAGGKVEGGTKFLTNEASVCCKAWAPTDRHGTSALHPGLLEFDAGSGELEAEGSKEAVKAKTEGDVKLLGYAEQELIDTKNP
jgi:hypothetical protein